MSRRAIAAELWSLYGAAPAQARLKQSARAYIVPYEQLLEWLPEGDSLLDIGCGVGAFIGLAGARHPYSKIVGIDREEAISIAQRTHDDPRMRFLAAGDFADWPHEQFDCVSVVDVLHHIAPGMQDGFLRALLERVGSGGRLIYKDMADGANFSAWFNRVHDLLSAQEWIAYYPLERARATIQDAGFTILHEEPIACGPYAHELIVAQRP
jgi:2-polyprenyl-3-methyl-5-hydroxy-6-metoxy-1,4-benzoquinol methylase